MIWFRHWKFNMGTLPPSKMELIRIILTLLSKATKETAESFFFRNEWKWKMLQSILHILYIRQKRVFPERSGKMRWALCLPQYILQGISMSRARKAQLEPRDLKYRNRAGTLDKPRQLRFVGQGAGEEEIAQKENLRESAEGSPSEFLSEDWWACVNEETFQDQGKNHPNDGRENSLKLTQTWDNLFSQ